MGRPPDPDGRRDGGRGGLRRVPFETVGYAALALLVHTVLLTGARASFASVLGLAACVGCLWPVGAAALAAVGGIASPLATVVPGLTYDLSTLLFVVTAGVLRWAARGRRRSSVLLAGLFTTPLGGVPTLFVPSALVSVERRAGTMVASTGHSVRGRPARARVRRR